ncbi:MAG TPA: beta-ketoacyl-[acyl-carrier-protein] synthase family protein [Planctomycetaceae bacterium]|nr:beta-ketoacyl-[acyl-carrier-protein] synthase family protein [Planctomycetaceae bacterium]
MTVVSQGTRVVISGLGVVSPIGIGAVPFWESLCAGRSGVMYHSAFPDADIPSRFAAEVRDFIPEEHVSCKRLLKAMSRDIQLGVSAASQAMADAALQAGSVNPERLGVVFGAGRMTSTPQELADAAAHCCGADGEFRHDLFNAEAMSHIAPLWLLRQLPNMAACHVSIEFDAQGPNNTITARDSSVLLALAEAVSCIERDAADAMIVGACSSHTQPVDVAKFHLFEGLSHHDGDPAKACRPFDLTRDGTVVGEGAGAFVIERLEHAQRRGARIYSEILAVTSGCDGREDGEAASGRGLVLAIQAALRRAGIDPRELGHINAHGKSTQPEDVIEARAYHAALGTSAESIPVTALKSYFGQFDCGSGAVELAGSLLALRHGELPATLNYRTPDSRCRLRVVRDEPRRLRNPLALKVSRTSMGQSAAVVLRAAT